MSALENDRPRHLIAEWDEGIAAIPFKEDGRWKVRYEVVQRAPREDDEGTEPIGNEADMDHGATGNLSASKQAVLDLFGAWSHLDEDEMIEALDRIRHESVPTPPIKFDDE